MALSTCTSHEAGFPLHNRDFSAGQCAYRIRCLGASELAQARQNWQEAGRNPRQQRHSAGRPSRVASGALLTSEHPYWLSLTSLRTRGRRRRGRGRGRSDRRPSRGPDRCSPNRPRYRHGSRSRTRSASGTRCDWDRTTRVPRRGASASASTSSPPRASPSRGHGSSGSRRGGVSCRCTCGPPLARIGVDLGKALAAGAAGERLTLDGLPLAELRDHDHPTEPVYVCADVSPSRIIHRELVPMMVPKFGTITDNLLVLAAITPTSESADYIPETFSVLFPEGIAPR